MNAEGRAEGRQRGGGRGAYEVTAQDEYASACDELGGGRHLDRVADGAGHRAVVGVRPVGPCDALRISLLVHLQPVGRMDPLDDERLAVELDLTGDLSPETTVSGGEASCFERTPERAGQSAAGSGDEVVDRGRIRGEALLCDAVVLRDRTMDPEGDRFVAPRQPRAPPVIAVPLCVSTLLAARRTVKLGPPPAPQVVEGAPRSAGLRPLATAALPAG